MKLSVDFNTKMLIFLVSHKKLLQKILLQVHFKIILCYNVVGILNLSTLNLNFRSFI